MVKNAIASKLEALPTGHSERIISTRLTLERKQHLTHFSVYAPKILQDTADKESFY